MNRLRLLLVLLILGAAAVGINSHWIRGISPAENLPSPGDLIAFYESADAYSFRGTISIIEENGTSRLSSDFCGFVNSSSYEGVLMLRTFGSGYESSQIINWSHGHAVLRSSIWINGSLVEDSTDRRALKRFPDPLASYLRMGFNGSKILHAECSQNLCVLSFEKSWSVSSDPDDQKWHVTGRVMVEDGRLVEGRMRFTVEHTAQHKKWAELKDVHFEITYGHSGRDVCPPLLSQP